MDPAGKARRGSELGIVTEEQRRQTGGSVKPQNSAGKRRIQRGSNAGGRLHHEGAAERDRGHADD